MAKTLEDTDEGTELPTSVVQTVTFIDQAYDRRKLFLPNWAELVVVRGVVEVKSDDTLALDYLRKRPDFKEQGA
ncbi:hypothetical protein LOY46_13985 [Pseudomonas sichuanensis]|uniref:hypothetical protein n=1 Tax=Pseudomonas sichuanensis TaxID=2213015 RepID=UPI00215DDCE3|nr:hypothetical protein [Pseudomonas sichuanensis]UVK80703.1 hypothetical protein LOY46_13985 [Pseudomonas sichuanensis]